MAYAYTLFTIIYIIYPQMELLDHTQLSGHRQWRLAQLILACLTQGYVWVNGEDDIPEVEKGFLLDYSIITKTISCYVSYHVRTSSM